MTSIPPETIETQRLVLRRPLLSESQTVFDWACDPEVTRFMDWPTPSSAADVRGATEAAILDWENRAGYSWRICVKPASMPVGNIGCTIHNHIVNFGFVLARTQWGKNYGTEAAGAILQWALSNNDITRVEATCDIDNYASARVLEKIGMIRERVVEKFAIRPNMPGKPLRDAIMFSVKKEA